jgi:hypothetical protein
MCVSGTCVYLTIVNMGVSCGALPVVYWCVYDAVAQCRACVCCLGAAWVLLWQLLYVYLYSSECTIPTIDDRTGWRTQTRSTLPAIASGAVLSIKHKLFAIVAIPDVLAVPLNLSL